MTRFTSWPENPLLASSAQNWGPSLDLLPITFAFRCNYPDKISKECGECTGAKRLGQVAIPPPLLFSTHSTPRAMNKQSFLSALQIAHALIFLAADTTPDFFKDCIQ